MKTQKRNVYKDITYHNNMEKERLTIYTPSKLIKDYKILCKEFGIKISGRISILIEKDIKSLNRLKNSEKEK